MALRLRQPRFAQVNTAGAVKFYSARETALAALAAALATINGVVVVRNPTDPFDQPSAQRMVAVFDGVAGDPEMVLSPVSYNYSHIAELVVVTRTDVDLDGQFDSLLQSIDAKLAANRSLSGAVDYAITGAPQQTDLNGQGATGIKSARIPITLYYNSLTPLT
jgi:hypothetical protein